jgi:hypothetical protein
MTTILTRDHLLGALAEAAAKPLDHATALHPGLYRSPEMSGADCGHSQRR